MPDKKLWTSLSDWEKRERVGLRIGWKRCGNGEGWYEPTHRRRRYLDLPPWPTDDGLAFEEVWSKIVALDLMAILQVEEGKPALLALPSDHKSVHKTWLGDTWADAICHALYDLVDMPQEESR